MTAKKRKPSKHNITKYLTECFICNANAPLVKATLISRNANLTTKLYHIYCGRCRHAMLSMVENNGEGSSAVGFFTDLSAADTRRLKDDFCPIEPEIIMEIHTLLQKKRFFDMV